MLSRGNDLKGTISMVFLSAFFISIFAIGFFVVLNYSPSVLAQDQTKYSNNITLDFTNNTEAFNYRGLNITVIVKNATAPSATQFATLYYTNVSGATVAYNLTNDTDRTNTTHVFFYNDTPIIFGTDFNTTSTIGAYRNLTVILFNMTTFQCTSFTNQSCREYLNSSVTTGFFNFTVKEFSTTAGNTVFGITEPVISTQNGTNVNFSVRAPFDVNLTANQTFSTGYIVTGNGTAALSMVTYNGTKSFHNTSADIGFSDSLYNLFQNFTVYVTDAFGNKSFMNLSVAHRPFVFRVDTTSAVLTTPTVTVHNVSRNAEYKYEFNATTLNGSITITNNTNNNILGTDYPQWKVIKIYNISNSTVNMNITQGNWTLTNGSHVNMTFVAAGGGFNSGGTYNITYDRVQYIGSGRMYPGNYLNVTWYAADNNTMNSSVRLWDSRNNTFRTIVGTAISAPVGSNVSYYANISGNFTATGFDYNLPDGRFWFTPEAQDYARTTVGSANQTYVSTRLTSLKVNPIVWYQNHTLNLTARQVPNITQVSIFDNRHGNKTFTTWVDGVSTNANVHVNESLNVTFLRSNDNITVIRSWNGGGRYLNTNITVQSGGWNVVGLRGIVNVMNTTMFINDNATYSNGNQTVGENVDVRNQFRNVTHVSVFNATHEGGKFCTARGYSLDRTYGFTITSCSPLFNVSNIVAPEGWAWFIRTNANFSASFNVTAMTGVRT